MSLAGTLQRHHHADAAQLQADSVRARQRHQVGGQAGGHRGRLRRRRRRQVQRHAEPDARRHDQHRLRAGRGRRPAGQPRSLQPVLPREAAVLPRERRLLLGRQPGRGGSVLQPPHRPRRRRRGGADHRRRPTLGQGRTLQRRPAQHADQRPWTTSCRANNFTRGPRAPATCPIARRSAPSSSTAAPPAICAGFGPQQPDLCASTAGSASGRTPSCRASTPGPRRPATSTATTTPSTCASRTNLRKIDVDVGYQEVGNRLQPRSRLPDPARLSQARRAGDDPLPAEADLPGAPAARHRARLLGLRRLPGERLRAHRQPLAVQGQHRGAHRREPDAGGRAGAVRDLPGHLRAARRLQERRDPAGADDQPGAAGRASACSPTSAASSAATARASARRCACAAGRC